jgi:hypothetical protein
MKLVWSQSGPAQDRPRQVLLLAVVCIFLGSTVGAGGQAPRPLRAAAASLLATGGVFLFAGVAGLVLQKGRRSGPSLSIAAPVDPQGDLDRVSGLQQEEER